MLKRMFAANALLSFLSLAVLYAEPAAVRDTVYELPPVNIIGKAIINDTEIRNNGSLVTELSIQQIKDLNAMDLPSALRRVPGVTISRHNLVGSYGGAEGGSIYIRGMGSGRPGASIQTLVDGVPKFVGVWTHPLMDLLSVDQADRIDIYKSAQPVALGNMSFGAVNLVSRRMHEEGYRTDLTTAYGSHKTYNLMLNHGGKKDAFDYYLGSSFKGTDGHRTRADGQLRNYWGRLGYGFNSTWDASLIFSGSNNWADDPGSVSGPVPPRGRYKTRDYTLDLTLANKGEKVSGFIKAYANDGRLIWEQWSSTENAGFNTNTDYLNRGLRIQENFALAGATQLTVGLDYDSYGGRAVELHADPAKSPSMPNKYFFNAAGYASLSQVIRLNYGVSLTPSAGVRYNRHNVFDSEAAPQAGLVLAGNGWNVYGNYARGFNYMGVYSYWFYNTTWHYGTDAYKNLKPELVNHYELGLKLTPLKGISLDLSLFHDRGEHLIRFVPSPPPPPSFANLDEFRTTGFEAALNWSPHDRVSLFTGLTVLGKKPAKVPYAPGYTFTFGSNLRLSQRLALNLDVEAIDDQYVSNPRFGGTPGRVGSYVIANGKLSWYPGRLAGGGGRSVFLAVDNFTDTGYEYRPGYPMPGASAFLGLSLDY